MEWIFKIARKKSRFCGTKGVFALVFLLGGLWIAQGGFFNVPIAHAAADDNGSGFLWTDNFGWISLNCLNDWDGDPDTIETSNCNGSGGEYGVSIDLSTSGPTSGQGNMAGHGWSPYLGLVCFGVTCRETGVPPDNSLPAVTFNLNNAVRIDNVVVALFSGWARVESHRNQGGNGGWIRFNGDTEQGQNILVGIRRGNERVAEIWGSAWQINLDGSGVGWIYFGSPPPGSAPEGIAGGDAGGDKDVNLPEPFGCAARETCGNIIDDDCDASYTGAPELLPSIGGRDCQDYECAGHSFYSSNVDSGEFCGPLPPGVEYKENALSNEDCFDRLDNDLDRFTDCADTDCVQAELSDGRTCKAEFVESEFDRCLDEIDNDVDGLTDCEDQECKNRDVCAGNNFLNGHDQCISGDLNGECVNECPGETHDLDKDLVCSSIDNCPNTVNPLQVDSNGNGIGDACDAFLETKEGSIYASRLRVARPPAGKYTATYCILTSAQGLAPFNATSELCPMSEQYTATATYCILTSAQGLAPFNATSELCQMSERYAASEFRLRQYPDTIALLPSMAQQTLRSYIDVAGLKAGRYGRKTDIGDSTDQLKLILENGNDKIIHRVGDLNLAGQEITIPSNRGAVTVLVEGNLTFDTGTKIVYASGASELRQVASIAWIVIDPHPEDDNAIGNINIDRSVQELVGAIFAANTISTGNETLPLTVRGLMVARRFEFKREYRSETGAEERGAELIIYDGRVALNPPPGLADFAKSLPTIRSIAPR